VCGPIEAASWSGLMTYRTASYADAQRQATPKGDEPVIPQQYLGATTKSQAFFRKMGESHAEAERLRQQCRSAMKASAARNLEEKVDLSFIENSIAQARNTSSFARGATTNDDSISRLGAGAPMWLGHLADPKHWEKKEPPPEALPAPGLPDSSGSEVQVLPASAMDPYSQGREDYSRQIAEALANSDDAASSKRNVKESDKSSPASAGESGAPEAASAQDIQVPASHEARGIKEESIDGRGSQAEVESEDRLIDESEDGSASEWDDSDASDAWPPSPPLMRFKMRQQFSAKFQPKLTQLAEKALSTEIKKMNSDLEDRNLGAHGHHKLIDDKTLAWLNHVFHMNVTTEYEFEVGFPVILITMLDAIYPKRVTWREVDWRFQYKRASEKNFGVLEGIWSEVNMDKAREFRVENTPLRLENLATCSVKEKLDFLGLMKRWFDQRIHHAGPYDPMLKRLEFVEQCKAWVNQIKFPHWIKFDKEHKVEISDMDAAERQRIQEYNKMPEYKRLIWFLGCQEYQTM